MKVTAFLLIQFTLYIVVQCRGTEVDKISDDRKEHEFSRELLRYILGNNDNDKNDNTIVKKIETKHVNSLEAWQGAKKHLEKFINFWKWFSSGFVNIFKGIKKFASKL